MATPLLHAQLAWLSHPQEMSEALAGFSARMWDLQVHSWHRALGRASQDVVSPNPDDTRFSDPIWNDSATWDIVKEWYLMLTRQVQDMLYDTPGLSNRDRRRAAFWWVSPTTNLFAKAFHSPSQALVLRDNSLCVLQQEVSNVRPRKIIV